MNNMKLLVFYELTIIFVLWFMTDVSPSFFGIYRSDYLALVNYLRTMELSLALKFLDFLGEVALAVVLNTFLFSPLNWSRGVSISWF